MKVDMQKHYVSVVFPKFSQSGHRTGFGNISYMYFVPKSWNVQINDTLIVNPREDEYICVKVIQIEGFTKSLREKATKWAVAKVDPTHYINRTKAEAITQEIKGCLRARKEEFEERMIYEKLASEDPEIKKLLERLEKIESGQLMIE